MAGSNKSSRKKIVVATSGGFDPIHVGHVRLFQEAKKLGDTLIVLLNNDNWLTLKKGSVFMPQEERKEIIEAFACVDEVILTSHTPNTKDISVCADLEKIRPDVFAKGGDRTFDNIPEVAVCDAIGCKMVFNLGRGGKIQSSSWLLEKHTRTQKLREQAQAAAGKRLFMFDLDGTLTESKANLDKEMAKLLCQLLEKKIVVVIGGGNYPQFETQFLNRLKCAQERLENLFVLPTSGGRMYQHKKGKWQLIYKNAFTAKEKKSIKNAFKKVFADISYVPPKKLYGELIEDRESQITFSALGQKAPVAAKKKWNETQDMRPQIKAALEKYLPNFEVRMGGMTSIDVTKKGMDKAYGIAQVEKYLHIPIKDMVYIGDALFEGGNDYAAIRTGVDTVQISGPEETKYIIQKNF